MARTPKVPKTPSDGTKPPKFYPADDVPVKKSEKQVHNPPKLRASITPGTILILLAGRFKGKRVVFLKQLASGLLLVTGPYNINGVPLRRINQRYVIATSTKVDVTGVDTSKIEDDYFKTKKEKKSKGESQFFEAEKEEKKVVVTPEKKEDQKAVDSKIIASIKSVPLLKEYLAKRFGLKQGQRPHLLKF